ncbi:unnamed protein product [Heligmosomoides polygyrus]|uniref:Ovule protein n=1 Tax=Heligmosomoides polygyrus TaxID=6339 RepID=A0A183FYD7_HELPZ|nr:unnamed protein product [Heligmosomoides polygyrus]
MSFEEVVVEKSPFFRLLRSRGCFFFSSSEKDKHIRISAGTQLREKYDCGWISWASGRRTPSSGTSLREANYRGVILADDIKFVEKIEFRFLCQGEKAATSKKRSFRKTINWDLFTPLAGLWKDTFMDNIDQEYDHFVHHLSDSTKGAESFKTTKRRLSPKLSS